MGFVFLTQLACFATIYGDFGLPWRPENPDPVR
jgi:hypothetical protein